MYKRISKREARKRFSQGEGFVLCPCQYYPSEGGFSMGFHLNPHSIAAWKERAAWYSPEGILPNSGLWEGNIDKTAWELMYRHWASSSSLASKEYAHYYVEAV